MSVSDGLFELMGLRTVAGRGFTREEHQPGRNNAAVLDHGFWHRTFGGDAGALGQLITIGGARYTIVGVLAEGGRLPADVPGARVPSEADVYLPIAYDGAFSATATAQRRSNSLAVLARSRATATPAIIDEDLRRIARELQAAFPQTNADLTMNAISVRDLLVGDVRRPLLVLLGAVGFVLLIACANVASLIVARASARQDELAVRTALGARRGRLVRQLLTEAVVLGVAGGALGLVLAYAATKALVAADPADIPRLAEIELDWTVVLFTLVVSLLASFATRRTTGAAGDEAVRARAARWSSWWHRRPERATPAERPDRHRSRSCRGAPRRRRPVASQLERADPRGPRIRRRAGHVVPYRGVRPRLRSERSTGPRGGLRESAPCTAWHHGRCDNLGTPPERTRSAVGLQRDRCATADGCQSRDRCREHHSGLSLGDRSHAGDRAGFHEPRWRQRAADRDHQRGSGSPLVPRRQASRETGADGRHSGDRGRGDRHASGRPETADGTSTVRSACAASNAHCLAHRPHRRTA